MSPPPYTAHALQAMLARSVSFEDVRITMAEPEVMVRSTYYGRPAELYQRRDIAIAIREDGRGRMVIRTVLYRLEEQWRSEDGRPSGRRLSANQRRRIEALLRVTEAEDEERERNEAEERWAQAVLAAPPHLAPLVAAPRRGDRG